MTEKLAKALEACELIVAVKHCMMMKHVHADFTVDEILEKYKAPSVQELAHKAQEIAEQALKMD